MNSVSIEREHITWHIVNDSIYVVEDKETVTYTEMTTMEKIKEVHSLMWAYPSTIQDRLASKNPADP